MPGWKPDLYLRFAAERTQPCRDLAARIALENPRRVIDLGCGPGNSTEVLAARWPRTELAGLDSSAEMIARARSLHPGWQWLAGDIADWTHGEDRFDVVFSNAAMQWVPDHQSVFPRLMARVAPDGALAVQMPGNFEAEAHRLMRAVASRLSGDGWRSRMVRPWRRILLRRVDAARGTRRVVVHRVCPRNGWPRRHRRVVQRLGDAPVSGCAPHGCGTGAV